MLLALWNCKRHSGDKWTIIGLCRPPRTKHRSDARRKRRFLPDVTNAGHSAAICRKSNCALLDVKHILGATSNFPTSSKHIAADGRGRTVRRVSDHNDVHTDRSAVKDAILKGEIARSIHHL